MLSSKLLLICVYEYTNLPRQEQEQLYEEFYHLVYNMVFYIVRDHGATEDIIHEALMRALEKKPTYIDQEKIEAWLKVLTRNVTFNYLRKFKKNRDELSGESVYIVKEIAEHQQPSVEKQTERNMLRQYLYEAIGHLKPEYQQVLVLRYIHDLTYKEMAATLQTTEGTVRQRLFRAKEKLKETIDRNGGEWE